LHRRRIGLARHHRPNHGEVHMIGSGNFSFFAGLAAFDVHAAATTVMTAGSGLSHSDLAGSLGAMQSRLKDHEENSPLRGLYDAIDGYRRAVDTNDFARITAAQAHLAGTLNTLPNPIWRQATFPMFEPRVARRFSNLAYLADTLTALRHVA